jgi:hypothetical protein
MANPIILPEEMLPFFTHVSALEIGAAASHYPHRVAAGVGVDAEEGFRH